MEKPKFKAKDDQTNKVIDEITRNALGIPLVTDSVPTKDDIKPNVLTFSGTDAYIKLANGKLIRITGVEV